MNDVVKLAGICVCGHWDSSHVTSCNPLGIRKLKCHGDPRAIGMDNCGCDDYQDANAYRGREVFPPAGYELG